MRAGGQLRTALRRIESPPRQARLPFVSHWPAATSYLQPLSSQASHAFVAPIISFHLSAKPAISRLLYQHGCALPVVVMVVCLTLSPAWSTRAVADGRWRDLMSIAWVVRDSFPSRPAMRLSIRGRRPCPGTKEMSAANCLYTTLSCNPVLRSVDF